MMGKLVWVACSLFFLVGTAGSAEGQMRDTSQKGGVTVTHSAADTKAAAVVQQNAGELISVPRELIVFYDTMMKIIAGLVGLAALIFGGLLGINLFQGRDAIRDAQNEVKEIRKAREEVSNTVSSLAESARRIESETVNRIRVEASKTIEDIVKKELEIKHIEPYKDFLLEELGKAAPDKAEIYHRLTDTLGYPDTKSLEIFTLCLTKFNGDEDICRAVVRGLKIAGEKGVIAKKDLV